jgi:hypothetical protein
MWLPSAILRFIESRESSTQIILVKTDLGDGYLKAMGNPEGEHVLACELVGSQLAKWFKLPTFEFGIVSVSSEDELPFGQEGKKKAKPGPAFISKADAGEPWSGSARELNRVFNEADISRLVVFDTWIRNRDRYCLQPNGKPRQNLNNVFLSESAPEGKLLLRAIDHTHCFANGNAITEGQLGVDSVQDAKVYGLFPAFRPFLQRALVCDVVKDLQSITKAVVDPMIACIPQQWDVRAEARRSLAEFVVGRAKWLAAKVSRPRRELPRIMTMLWPQGELFPLDEPESGK